MGIRHRAIFECYPEVKPSLPPSLPPSLHLPIHTRGIAPRVLQHEGQERVDDESLHHVADLGPKRKIGGREGRREGGREGGGLPERKSRIPLVVE